MSPTCHFTTACAAPFQRVLFFLGANEIGGHAYLYRILQTTRHPLHIVYAVRRPGDGARPFHYVLKSEPFRKALTDSRSTMMFYESPGNWLDYRNGGNWLDAARKPILRFCKIHGDRPISYMFINGHEKFGFQRNHNENKMVRQLRLEKYWAPYRGALTRIATPNKNNPFDYQRPFVTTKLFVSQMSAVLTALLPMVRNDGEGVVVLKTPRDGRLEIIGSRRMRADFVNPTPHFYESSVLELRKAADISMKDEIAHIPPWPHLRNNLRLGDIFAKSAIAMYQSFTPYQNITFHRCAHDPEDIDGPVSLLMDPSIPKPASPFTQEDLDSLNRDYREDVQDLPPARGGLIRRTENPYFLPHNQNRGVRTDWVNKNLPMIPKDGRPLIRSVIPTLSMDDGSFPSRYNPFDTRSTSTEDIEERRGRR
ncbi:hypothetical protein TWF506_005912 [Arthrobotrys conoides]|uniref:Uncharacterized protein n=1 Tax=Arthrobotrys conoides TaxID=74498 RepID=A0AAN8P7J5_9PEZI